MGSNGVRERTSCSATQSRDLVGRQSSGQEAKYEIGTSRRQQDVTQLDDRYQTGGQPRELPRTLDVAAATLTFSRCATAPVHISVFAAWNRLTSLPLEPKWSMQAASIRRRWYLLRHVIQCERLSQKPDTSNALSERLHKSYFLGICYLLANPPFIRSQ